MSNSNNYNQYPDSDDEDTNSVEHIYTEKNTGEVQNNRPTQPFTFGGSYAIPTTVAGAFSAQHATSGFGQPGFGQPPAQPPTIGAFGQPAAQPSAQPSTKLEFGQPSTKPGFGQPAQSASGWPAGQHSAGQHSAGQHSAAQTANRPATTVAGGFSGLGGLGFGFRAERHPETGLPMGCNLRPPQGVCGINNPTNTSEILNSQSSNKQKIIDELYKKLANARAQIQNLNKSIDDIYEIIPKIN